MCSCFDNAAVVWAILGRISALGPPSDIMAPKLLKFDVLQFMVLYFDGGCQFAVCLYFFRTNFHAWSDEAFSRPSIKLKSSCSFPAMPSMPFSKRFVIFLPPSNAYLPFLRVVLGCWPDFLQEDVLESGWEQASLTHTNGCTKPVPNIVIVKHCTLAYWLSMILTRFELMLNKFIAALTALCQTSSKALLKAMKI